MVWRLLVRPRSADLETKFTVEAVWDAFLTVFRSSKGRLNATPYAMIATGKAKALLPKRHFEAAWLEKQPLQTMKPQSQKVNLCCRTDAHNIKHLPYTIHTYVVKLFSPLFLQYCTKGRFCF